MKLVIERTSDGSDTLRHPVTGDTYHSSRGAVGESRHIFIEHGLAAVFNSIHGKAADMANQTDAKCPRDEAVASGTKSVVADMAAIGADGRAIEANGAVICTAADKTTGGEREISILEIGFGSGLNAWLSLEYALTNGLSINYIGLELYPVDMETVLGLNYAADPLYVKLHESPWEESCKITDGFTLTKRRIDFTKAIFPKHDSAKTDSLQVGNDHLTDNIKKTDFTETVYTKDNFADIIFGRTFDLVYFDAFAPAVQPEMWAPEQFAKLYDAMNSGGILVTYSAAGNVKRALAQAGFRVERLAGALGKRHMSRAVKG